MRDERVAEDALAPALLDLRVVMAVQLDDDRERVLGDEAHVAVEELEEERGHAVELELDRPLQLVDLRRVAQIEQLGEFAGRPTLLELRRTLPGLLVRLALLVARNEVGLRLLRAQVLLTQVLLAQELLVPHARLIVLVEGRQLLLLLIVEHLIELAANFLDQLEEVLLEALTEVPQTHHVGREKGVDRHRLV